jgi:hypothetical protein
VSNFTLTSKAVDRERPFHRINSPSFDVTLNKGRVSGIGVNCGCRTKKNYIQGEGPLSSQLAPDAVIVLPQYVPVEREGQRIPNWGSIPETEMEVEGLLSLSQHPSEDFPIGQWHFWYDWNFFVKPAGGFEYIRGMGTHEDLADLILGGSMECEWDCGAFGDYDFISPGGRTPTLDASAAFFGSDWAWPVGGEYIWLRGRWIYDCGHPDDLGRNRSELHPIKAVATARWEAVQFDENDSYVPAIQFMFFTCRKGGYMDMPTIVSTDYEFIIDLPDSAISTGKFPIGHTPDFPLNTLVVRRPQLLHKFDREPFITNARKPVAQPGQADPEIEILPPANPGEVPKQVKVRIPLTQLTKSGEEEISSYGVIVSLGWADPERQQAEKIKEVRIVFTEIELHGDLTRFFQGVFFDNKILSTIRFVFRVGVNGRWHALDAPDVNLNTTSLGLKHQGVTMYLAEDDDIRITCTGMEEDPSGEMLRRRLEDRVLINPRTGDPYNWLIDFDQRDDDYASRIADQMASKGIEDWWTHASRVSTLSQDLGKVIPGLPMSDGELPNPLKVKDLMRIAGGPGHVVRGRQTARTRLEEHKSKGVTTRETFDIDYFLHYMLEYHDLPK